MAQAQQIQKTQPVPKTFAELLQQHRGEFLKVIPRKLDPDRLLRVAESAVKRQKLLLAADPYSVLKGVMMAASLGLEIDVLGEAYLVPYKNGGLSRQYGRDVYEATFIPGYRGLIKLARRSGVIDTINAKIVRKGDEFDFSDGSKPFIHHKQQLRMERAADKADESEAAENAEIVAAYMVAWVKGSSQPQIEVMDRADILRIRSRSKARDSGPWVTDFAEMCRKCPVRRGAKYLPTEADFGRALVAEDRFEAGESAAELFPEIPDVLPGENAKDVTPQPAKDVAQAVAEKLGVRPPQDAINNQGAVSFPHPGPDDAPPEEPLDTGDEEAAATLAQAHAATRARSGA